MDELMLAAGVLLVGISAYLTAKARALPKKQRVE